MIIDVHAHVFPHVGNAGLYSSVEEHLRDQQLNTAQHPQGARRFRDNALVTEPTLWDGKSPDLSGLQDVNFHVGRFGRFEWEKDGERYYAQFFPPTLDHMEATDERMLAQMQYAGVDKAVIQFGKRYSNTHQQMSELARRWPNQFRCCTWIDEDEADEEEQILFLRHTVRDLGLTALCFWCNGFAKSNHQNHLDDEKYIPLWEEVQSLGIPVSWDIRHNVLRSDRALYMGQVVRLRRHARRFPRIQNVLTHFVTAAGLDASGQIPEDLWSLLEEPNVTVELLFPLLFGAKWEYPYVEAQPIIRQIYEKLGPAKMMWGADMPNVERSCTYRQSLDYLWKHCGFVSAADMDQILGSNAERIYFSVTPTWTGREEGGNR